MEAKRVARAKFDISQIMNSASMEAVQSLQPQSRYMVLPIEAIDPSPKNKYSMQGIEELATNIELCGLLQSLLVREKEDGRYEVISGHRRREALKLLAEENAKYTQAPCTVIRCQDDVEAELKLLSANSTARTLTDSERVYQAERIRDLLIGLKRSGYKFGMRMREVVAQMMQVSSTTAGRYESIITNLVDDWRKAFDAGRINVSTAYEISRLAEAEQKHMWEMFDGTGAVVFPEPEQSKRDGAAEAELEMKRADPEQSSDAATENIIDEAREIRDRKTEDRTIALIEGSMEGGIQSGEKIGAEQAGKPIVIHVVSAYFNAIRRGEKVCFSDYGTGKCIFARMEVVDE